jgi:hypothetical protein
MTFQFSICIFQYKFQFRERAIEGVEIIFLNQKVEGYIKMTLIKKEQSSKRKV